MFNESGCRFSIHTYTAAQEALERPDILAEVQRAEPERSFCQLLMDVRKESLEKNPILCPFNAPEGRRNHPTCNYVKNAPTNTVGYWNYVRSLSTTQLPA